MRNREVLFRKSILLVALANLSYFFVEFFVAKDISSASLFADSIDFLEDASVNILIFQEIIIPSKSKFGIQAFVSSSI